MVARFAVLDAPLPLAIAHRGGASSWPENTMPAFQGAVDLGFRFLETDVHCTADGVLVAFHDDRLDRVTDRTGLICELPYAEVAKALVDGLEPIPLFEDLLRAFPDVRFNIDPKADDAVEPLARVLQQADAIDRVCVGAFSDARLERIRHLCGPGLCTSLGPKKVMQLLAASKPGIGKVLRPRFVEGAAQVPHRAKGVTVVTQGFVDTAHHLGLQVHVWTIDDPVEMHQLLDLGVDGVMTDQPAVLKGVLQARGVWAG
ncbi:MAG: glycerophosphodiester phosphodiesterase [Actinobacteria bacterium]|nr:glycerophosphodiester phosphodiesterase [Actinomycetota bacterium]